MGDFEKLKEELPSKEKFYSSLTDGKSSEKEYEHVVNVWNKFEMKKMKDYHDLGFKSDVSVLVDAFQKFTNNSFMIYGLCQSHYLSAQGLNWDAMLKMKKKKKTCLGLFQILSCIHSLRKVQKWNFLCFQKIQQSQQ